MRSFRKVVDDDEKRPGRTPAGRTQSADHIRIGDITRSGAVAAGRGARAVYQGLSYEEVVALFGTLDALLALLEDDRQNP